MAAIIFWVPKNRLAKKDKIGHTSPTSDPLFNQQRTLIADFVRP